MSLKKAWSAPGKMPTVSRAIRVVLMLAMKWARIIQAGMRGEFERAGVWDLLRKQIRAAEYTRPGDPLRIDMGYRPN
jgi:hypothetical protein